MKWKTVLFLTTGAIIIIIYTLLHTAKQRTFNDDVSVEYLSKHDIQFGGIVTNKIVWDHEWGIFCLNLNRSNRVNYNPFKLGEKYFFCYINNNYAEIYTGGLDLVNIKDSILINYKIDSMYVYRDLKKIHSWPITISTSDFYYDWLKKTHVDK